MPGPTIWNALAANWSTLVIAVLWQSTVLAVVVGVVAWLLRTASPAIRYWLWQIVAIKILLAPLWTLAVPFAWWPADVIEPPLVPLARSTSQPGYAAAAHRACPANRCGGERSGPQGRCDRTAAGSDRCPLRFDY